MSCTETNRKTTVFGKLEHLNPNIVSLKDTLTFGSAQTNSINNAYKVSYGFQDIFQDLDKAIDIGFNIPIKSSFQNHLKKEKYSEENEFGHLHSQQSKLIETTHSSSTKPARSSVSKSSRSSFSKSGRSSLNQDSFGHFDVMASSEIYGTYLDISEFDSDPALSECDSLSVSSSANSESVIFKFDNEPIFDEILVIQGNQEIPHITITPCADPDLTSATPCRSSIYNSKRVSTSTVVTFHLSYPDNSSKLIPQPEAGLNNHQSNKHRHTKSHSIPILPKWRRVIKNIFH